LAAKRILIGNKEEKAKLTSSKGYENLEIYIDSIERLIKRYLI
jgi:hypothetical protein